MTPPVAPPPDPLLGEPPVPLLDAPAPLPVPVPLGSPLLPLLAVEASLAAGSASPQPWSHATEQHTATRNLRLIMRGKLASGVPARERAYSRPTPGRIHSLRSIRSRSREENEPMDVLAPS